MYNGCVSEKKSPEKIAIIQRQKQHLRTQEAALFAHCFRRVVNEEVIFLERNRDPGYKMWGLRAYEIHESGVQDVGYDLGSTAILHCNGVPYASLTKTSGLRGLVASMPPATVVNRNHALPGHLNAADAAQRLIHVSAGEPTHRLWVANGGVVYGATLRTQARPSELLLPDDLPLECRRLADKVLPQIVNQTGDMDLRTVVASFDMAYKDAPRLQRVSLQPERIHSYARAGSRAFAVRFAEAEATALLGLRQKLLETHD